MEEISESDVIAALQRANLKYQVKGRYIISQCPKHNDQNPSVQIFKDDWFVSCLAGCGRFHITDPFPELRGWEPNKNYKRSPPVEERKIYTQYDLFSEWETLPPIPPDFEFKKIPIQTLHDLGWRILNGEIPGMGSGFFIPYFNHTKTKIPFAQTRHLSGERRFTFLPGAKPTAYGKWNIAPKEKLFVVEGASDCAVMEQCGVPWIGMPSAASKTILKAFAQASRDMEIDLVWAGDNDAAGRALKDVLDEVGIPYRVWYPPEEYKDWGDFYEDAGTTKVFDWCKEILFE